MFTQTTHMHKTKSNTKSNYTFTVIYMLFLDILWVFLNINSERSACMTEHRMKKVFLTPTFGRLTHDHSFALHLPNTYTAFSPLVGLQKVFFPAFFLSMPHQARSRGQAVANNRYWLVQRGMSKVQALDLQMRPGVTHTANTSPRTRRKEKAF